MLTIIERNSSILGNLSDKIILRECINVFYPSMYQYCCAKELISPYNAHKMVNRNIQHSTNNGSHVNGALLGVTEAFNHDEYMLSRKLTENGLYQLIT